MAEDVVILIIYTTKYRLGGHQFPVVAETLAAEKRGSGFAGEVISRAVESKREVLHEIDEIKQAERKIKEFVFVGHSGMYGPMFGTVAFPEQFSPFEWEQMEIPFGDDASAFQLYTQVADGIRDVWSRRDLIVQLLHPEIRAIVEQYREAVLAGATAWRAGYLAHDGAVLGPRAATAMYAIFHWNRAALSAVDQALVAAALSQRAVA